MSAEEGRVWKGKQVTAARLVISPTRDIPDNATIAVYAPPLAWSQLALILDLADTAGLREEFPKAYEALDEIRLGLDAVMELAPVPSPREQWDRTDSDRDKLLAGLDVKMPVGIEPETDRNLDGD